MKHYFFLFLGFTLFVSCNKEQFTPKQVQEDPIDPYSSYYNNYYYDYDYQCDYYTERASFTGNIVGLPISEGEIHYKVAHITQFASYSSQVIDGKYDLTVERVRYYGGLTYEPDTLHVMIYQGETVIKTVQILNSELIYGDTVSIDLTM